MPNKVLAEIAHRGTTTFFRDLSPKETSAICHINRGKGTAPSRAGNKKLDEKEKKERQAKSDRGLERIYRKLLQEKYDADRSDLRWAQEGGPDPGVAFADPAAGTAQFIAATTVGNGQSINTQIPGPTNNTPFLEYEGDTTLVEEDLAANHSTRTEDPFKYELATAKNDPDSNVTPGAPPGYVAANSLPHGFEPDRPLWETPVIQQPSRFDDPQYQMMGNSTFSQDEDAFFYPTQIFGPPDPEFEHFMPSMPKNKSTQGNYSPLQ